MLWAPSGIAIATLTRVGLRAAPIVFVGATLINLIAGAAPLVAAVIGIGNTAEALIGAYLLRRASLPRADWDLSCLKTFIVRAGVPGPIVAATIGVLALMLDDSATVSNAWFVWITWFLGDAGGALLIAPIALTWRARRPWHRSAPSIELPLAIAAIACTYGIATVLPAPGPLAMVLAPVPIVTVMALRQGLFEALVTTLAAAIVVLYGSHTGLWAQGAVPPESRAWILWSYLAMVTGLAMLVSGFRVEREQAMRRRLLLEQQLLRSERLESLAVLAGGIAHDFNNLLQIVLGNTTLLRQNNPATASQRLDRIEIAARQAAYLCAQLQTYGGGGATALSTLSLADLVTNMTEVLALPTPHGSRLHIEASQPVTPISGDAALLRQLVLNLGLNAVDAVRANGSGDVRISVHDRTLDAAALATALVDDSPGPGAFVVLTVEDEGTGLPDGVRERMLDPFFTTREGGHGLGLAAVRGIVRTHRGVLWADNCREGGAQVTIALPIEQDDATTGERLGATTPLRARSADDLAPVTLSPEAGPAHDGAGATETAVIFVLDDEPAVREVAVRMLRREGFASDAVDTFVALRERLNDEPRCAAILIDVHLGGEDGVWVLRQLRLSHPHIALVLTSGDDDNARFVVHDGKTSFLAKPWRRPQLRAALTAAGVTFPS